MSYISDKQAAFSPVVDHHHHSRLLVARPSNTQPLYWCLTGLVPNVLPQRDEGSGKPWAVEIVEYWHPLGLEPETFGSTVYSEVVTTIYVTAAHKWTWALLALVWTFHDSTGRVEVTIYRYVWIVYSPRLTSNSSTSHSASAVDTNIVEQHCTVYR